MRGVQGSCVSTHRTSSPQIFSIEHHLDVINLHECSESGALMQCSGNAISCHTLSTAPPAIHFVQSSTMSRVLSRRDRLRLAKHDPFKPEAWVGLEPLPPNTRAPEGFHPPLLQTGAINCANPEPLMPFRCRARHATPGCSGLVCYGLWGEQCPDLVSGGQLVQHAALRQQF